MLVPRKLRPCRVLVYIEAHIKDGLRRLRLLISANLLRLTNIISAPAEGIALAAYWEQSPPACSSLKQVLIPHFTYNTLLVKTLSPVSKNLKPGVLTL